MKGGKLAIGIEDVELTGILAEGGTVARVVVIVFRRVEKPGHRFQQLTAIIGKVLEDAYSTLGERHNGNQIRSGHLRPNEALSGEKSAVLVGRRRGHHVEEKDQ